MKKILLALALVVFAPYLIAEDEFEMGVFDMQVLKDGEVLAKPMLAVYLNKPDAPPSGPATVTVGSENGHVVHVLLNILQFEESAAQVMVEYGYNPEDESGFRMMEEVTLPWREEVRLHYQRDSRSPEYEFLISLSRESEAALRERMKSYEDDSAN